MTPRTLVVAFLVGVFATVTGWAGGTIVGTNVGSGYEAAVGAVGATRLDAVPAPTPGPTASPLPTVSPTPALCRGQAPGPSCECRERGNTYRWFCDREDDDNDRGRGNDRDDRNGRGRGNDDDGDLDLDLDLFDD